MPAETDRQSAVEPDRHEVATDQAIEVCSGDVRAALSTVATASLAFAMQAQAAPEQPVSGWSLLNMTQGVTEMSRRIYDLHMLIFWVCVAIVALASVIELLT